MSENASQGIKVEIRSFVERKNLLESLQRKLPPAGCIESQEWSPSKRRFVLLVEFLKHMSQEKEASLTLLSKHPAYQDRRFNFVGAYCRSIGLQWVMSKGKKMFPPTAANILKLCYALHSEFPEALGENGSFGGIDLDQLIDKAMRAISEEEEGFELRDEFVDLPEDFTLTTCPIPIPIGPTQIANVSDPPVQSSDWDDVEEINVQEQVRMFLEKTDSPNIDARL